MSKAERILVVTPTLGTSPFLERTVASVTTQPLAITHVMSAPLEHVDTLRRRFPHARVVMDAGKAGGIYGALNAALAFAATDGDWDWFTYINDDDALLPGFARMWARHTEDEGVIYGDVDLVDDEDRRLSRITVERAARWIPALLQQGISPLMQQGMLFRR